MNGNVFTLITVRKSGSQPRSGRERSGPPKLGQANARAVTSRELDSASLRKLGRGQSAEDDEARIGGGAAIMCIRRNLRGWANCFGLGYPWPTFRGLNHFVRYRLGVHLRRRRQRGWRTREGVSR